MIPILIRTKQRVNYLNITLHSLLGSDIQNSQIIISDDCSISNIMKQFLYTSNEIKIEQITWLDEIEKEVKEKAPNNKFFGSSLNNEQIFKKYIGNIPNPSIVHGISNKITVISPDKNLGDKNGLLWNIRAGFELFKASDRIIIIEDDLIFNKDWFKIANQIYQKQKDNVGLVSVYNRENERIILQKNSYYQNPTIGGVMYIISRNFYQKLKSNKIFTQIFLNKENLGGDVYIQDLCIKYGFKIYNSINSYIQHIGIKSLCRPGRFLRYSKNFIFPYTWSKYV